MSKNLVEPDGPQMTSQYGAYELHAGHINARACTRLRDWAAARTRAHTYTNM